MKKESYDYIIIGAGISGLSSAYYLSKDGYKVLVLEADDGKNSASFASTAEMNHDPDAHWDTVVEHFGIEGAKSLWKLCANAIDTISEFAHQVGEKHFRTDRLPAYFFTYRESDVPILKSKFDVYTSIDAHVSLDTKPRSDLHQSFKGVLTTHGDGVTNNQQLLKTLAHFVHEQEGEIVHNQKVVRIEGNTAVTVPGEVYMGEHIIIATGDGGGLVPTTLEIEHKRTFVLAYEKDNLPDLFTGSVMWDTDEPYHYMRSFDGNRLWVGGEDVYEKDYTPSTDADEKKYKALDTYAREVLGIDDTYVREGAWSAQFYPTKRGIPYIGAVEGTPQIISVGFGGTGIVTSFISGYLIAAWARGELLEYQKLFALDWS